MKAQYGILHELKKLDDKILRLQADITRIPDEIQRLDASLSTHREEFQTAKSGFEASEKNLRKAELDLKEKESALQKAESKMMEVKTNEEYQAAMRENEGTKKEKGTLEETVMRLMSELDGQRGSIKEAEKVFKEHEAKLNEEKKTLESERQKLVKQLEELTQKKAESVKQLSPEIGSIYTRVSTRGRGGAAVVVVENGMCPGCNMRVQPQLFNEVLGFKALHRCQNCGRILIVAPKEQE